VASRGLESGSAIVWALLFVVITSGLVISHTTYMAARRGDRDARYNRAGLAETFARSGLQDAVGWFHGRSNQPITRFDPVRDPTAVPPRIETLDPTIGLVREFEINGNLWGRYEVRHEQAQDISAQRGDLVPGSVWALGVRAFVFRKRDANCKFDEPPNQLVGTKALQGEIRWLQMNPPAPAAICVDDPAQVVIGRTAHVDGAGSIAIAYRDPATVTPAPAATEPTIQTGATVVGTPTQLPAPTYDAGVERVFAMRRDELRTYSDLNLDNPVGTGGWDWLRFLEWLRSALSGGGTAATTADAVPTIESKLIVSKGLRLAGKLDIKNSLVFVDGDLTTAFGTDATINGILYVNGDAIFDSGKVAVNGTMIVRGKINIGTGFLSTTSIRYDAAIIDDVRRTVGKYRSQRARSGNP
jgi:hypothetical protein